MSDKRIQKENNTNKMRFDKLKTIPSKIKKMFIYLLGKINGIAFTVAAIIGALFVLFGKVFPITEVNILIAIVLIVIGVKRFDKFNWKRLAFAILCEVSCGSAVYCALQVLNVGDWMRDVRFMLLLLLSIYIAVAAVMKIQSINQDKKYKPYGIDINYEIRTHKYIGRDGGEECASYGIIDNLRKNYREYVNKEEKRYAVCNTYFEWKEHIKEILPKNSSNFNVLYWLIKRKRIAETASESAKIIVIPIYIILIQMCIQFGTDETMKLSSGALIICLGIIIVLLVTSLIITYLYSERTAFYDDFIEVVKEYKESRSKVTPVELMKINRLKQKICRGECVCVNQIFVNH